jgi:hypothetical protein
MVRIETLAALLASVVLVAGCAAVPTAGPVEHHDSQQGGVSSGVQVAPLPPADGATQLLVVEGFLHAMSTYEPGYQVARQYLTAEASKIWKPEAGVQVYADGYPPTETDQTVVLIAPITGAIDSSGVYQPASGQLRQDFGLVKNSDGQWRISHPPTGLLVSRYLFTTGFKSVNVNFMAASSQVLIPEPRYFPVGERTLIDAVAAILAGPSRWLAPLVRSGSFGEVTVESVDVDSSGLAQVKLGGAAGSLTKAQRDGLLAEITYTLADFDQVSATQVSSDDSIWTGADGSTEMTVSDFTSLDPGDSTSPRLLFVTKADKLQRQVLAGNWNDFSEVQASMPKLQSLAVSRELKGWAGVSEGGTKLLSGEIGGRTRQLRLGTKLLRPSFSRSGEIWSPAASSVSDLRVYRNGQAVPVSVRGVPRRSVVAVSLSADGNRLAVVLAKGGTTTIGLLRVRQSSSGIELDGWQELNLSLLGVTASTLLDVGWDSVTELAVLRSGADQQVSVIVLSQDGAQVNDIGPSDAFQFESLQAVPGRQAVMVSTSGALYHFDGEFNWLVSITDVDAAAYSG